MLVLRPVRRRHVAAAGQRVAEPHTPAEWRRGVVAGDGVVKPPEDCCVLKCGPSSACAQRQLGGARAGSRAPQPSSPSARTPARRWHEAGSHAHLPR
jgi:hypothetical protein